jgi:hypothetical protein
MTRLHPGSFSVTDFRNSFVFTWSINKNDPVAMQKLQLVQRLILDIKEDHEEPGPSSNPKTFSPPGPEPREREIGLDRLLSMIPNTVEQRTEAVTDWERDIYEASKNTGHYNKIIDRISYNPQRNRTYRSIMETLPKETLSDERTEPTGPETSTSFETPDDQLLPNETHKTSTGTQFSPQMKPKEDPTQQVALAPSTSQRQITSTIMNTASMNQPIEKDTPEASSTNSNTIKAADGRTKKKTSTSMKPIGLSVQNPLAKMPRPLSARKSNSGRGTDQLRVPGRDFTANPLSKEGKFTYTYKSGRKALLSKRSSEPISIEKPRINPKTTSNDYDKENQNPTVTRNDLQRMSGELPVREPMIKYRPMAIIRPSANAKELPKTTPDTQENYRDQSPLNQATQEPRHEIFNGHDWICITDSELKELKKSKKAYATRKKLPGNM